MLFNTSEFIFIFLPLTLALHFTAGRINMTMAAALTTASSLVFYAYWNPKYVVLPIASVAGNFLLARTIATTKDPRARRLLVLGIAADLLVLAFFKYGDFVVSILQGRLPHPPAVPLALSFTTFVQIAFLVYVWRHRPSFDLCRYAMFVSFFPHLIAGPIVRWDELGPQIADEKRYRPQLKNIALGLTIFCLGLGKKVLIADRLAPHIAPVFDAAGFGQAITPVAAWGACFAYSAQLYFDFSGYCDMAVGLGLLFNLRLPINFAAPLRATSVVDFWRRWHVTLSRFLRDFVYIPLGGGTSDPLRTSGNLIATMLLGGLWHGANWTFVAWGAFHGVLLAINHVWRSYRGRPLRKPVGAFFGWCATFTCFAISMAFFRSPSVGAAYHILSAMVAHGSAGVSPNDIRVTADLYAIRHGYLSESVVRAWFGVNWSVIASFSTVVALAIALIVPDTMELVDYREGEPHSDWRRRVRWMAWRPSPAWALVVIVIFATAFTFFWDFNEFLYYQF